MKEETTYKDGTPTESVFSEAEKLLEQQYPNFTNVTWEMIKNVNLVMKITLALFIIQAIAVGLLILVQVI